jgi:hypothetical protein
MGTRAKKSQSRSHELPNEGGRLLVNYLESSNDHYRRINERFDSRVGTLHVLGFKREVIEDLNLAVYVKRCGGLSKPRVVQTAFLSFADDRSWLDKLEELKRGG